MPNTNRQSGAHAWSPTGRAREKDLGDGRQTREPASLSQLPKEVHKVSAQVAPIHGGWRDGGGDASPGGGNHGETAMVRGGSPITIWPHGLILTVDMQQTRPSCRFRWRSFCPYAVNWARSSLSAASNRLPALVSSLSARTEALPP